MPRRKPLWALFVALSVGSEAGCGSGKSGGSPKPKDSGSASGTDGAIDAAAAGAAATSAGGVSAGGSGGSATGGKRGAGGAPPRTGDGGTTAQGGGSGSSAAGGRPATPPHTVRSCNALPAPGTWESILPPDITNTALVMVDPFDAGVVFVGAEAHGLNKSSDCGATWTHVNTGRNGSALDSGSIVSGAVDPIEKGVLYVAPIYGAGGLWKSTNGGTDWEQLFPSDSEVAKTVEYNFIDSVSMDPTDHLHVVVGTHANCHEPYAPACQAETTDGGKTWHIVKVPGDGWQEQAGPFVINQASWLYGSPNGLYLTEDHGASWNELKPTGGAYAFGGGEVENHGITIGADGTYYMTSYEGVIRSKNGRDWETIPNSGGRVVSLVRGGSTLYTSDQWSPSYHVASESDPLSWSVFPAPYAEPTDTGGVYLDYDQDHHILYSSNFKGGVWRVVTE